MMALCSAPGTEIDAACEEDTACLCANGCALEMMDCVESPLMRGERADVLFLQGICYDTEAGIGTPGDGVCSLRDAAALCDDDEMDEMDDMAALEGEEERDALP